MIKSYLNLDDKEKENVLEFIKENKNTYKSFKEFEEEVEGKICNYGEGVLFYLDNNGVKGKISVILELLKKIDTVYFNKLICPYDNKEILKELINEAKALANKYNANKILLGIRDENLLELSESIGLFKSYSSYNMILEKKEIIYPTLNKVGLSSDNIKDYIDIYNKSFIDMPHGTFIDFDEAREYLENQNTGEEYFMVTNDDGENIGFLNIWINNNKGFFDIGLIEEYRGRGYGKRLLETAIQSLMDKDIEDVCLTVIEKNKIAFEMYKKRGFRIYHKISDWIE